VEGFGTLCFLYCTRLSTGLTLELTLFCIPFGSSTLGCYPLKMHASFRIFMGFLLSPSTRKDPWSSEQLQVDGDFPEAHCTRDSILAHLAQLRKGTLEQECPTILGVQSMIYGKLRGQIQPKVGNPTHGRSRA
jgi:hypothetical protein